MSRLQATLFIASIMDERRRSARFIAIGLHAHIPKSQLNRLVADVAGEFKWKIGQVTQHRDDDRRLIVFSVVDNKSPSETVSEMLERYGLDIVQLSPIHGASSFAKCLSTVWAHWR